MAGPADALRAAADLFDPPPWEAKGRPPLEPHQVPPDEPFEFWLLEAGRGAGKTEACSRYYARYMNEHPGTRGRIIAPTLGDAVEACIDGPSGLLSVDPSVTWVPSAVGGSKVRWRNGSEALVLGTHTKRDVDRLRAAGNRELDWFEELAAFTHPREAWDQAAFGRRLGTPHVIASTTPRATAEYRKLRKLATVLTTATTYDNPHNPESWVEGMRARYENTRLGRQELLGLVIEDVEGALWRRVTIEAGRIDPDDLPVLVRVVVAIDPAATSGPNADDTGIVVAGKGDDGHGYVLADRTCHLGPEAWAQRAIRAYHQYEADAIVAESNNGGEMVEAVIRAADPNVNVKLVHASRGKQTRAEPVAALYGAPPKRPPQVHHVGGFPKLEDQVCTWVPGDEDSPDRLDALVWALTDLMLGESTSWRPL